MNCEQANQIDLVEYLFLLGYQSCKVTNQDYWFLSPLRQEKEPSFKVNKNKNIWYDHGLGKGGKLIDFAMDYNHCNISEALAKISSFHQQKNLQNLIVRPPFHSLENNLFKEAETRETAIKIIAATQPIKDLVLCRYLVQRRIDKSIADTYCHEIFFKLTNNEKEYRAIGFKNNAGGYELRNEYFKGSSSPKYVTYKNNEANNITVFEGFFDFLSHQSIHQNQQLELTNFLVLNSLSFFERSLLLIEKHEHIHLYLDNDEAGRKCTDLAQKRSQKFHDKSKLYKGYKDLNEWLMNFGKLKKKKGLTHSIRRHL